MNSGRERTPEAEAEAVMNQSSESVEDLLEGTEIYEDDDGDFEDGDVDDLLDDIDDGTIE